MFHGRGLAICSGRRCRWESAPAKNRRAGCWSAPGSAAIGRKGSQALAPSTLNMLPKLELAPMRMYFRMLTNTLRPSSTPSSSTIRFFSSRIMSADSLAMSTALSTEMPTSAARKRRRVVDAVAHEADDVAVASAAPGRCAACARAKGARKRRVVSTASASCASVMVSTWLPSRIFSAWMPTSLQTLRVTRSLSPVRTFTVTPCWRSAAMALAAVSLGGSRKAR